MELKDHTIYTAKGEVYYWKDDKYSELKTIGLKTPEINRKLVKERLKVLHPEAIISHNENGAPILHGHQFKEVSVSHSGSWYALYFSNEAVGVDIQLWKDSLFEGRSYFVNQREEETLDLTLTNLHLIWGAKESFYKSRKGEIEDLKEEVVIKEINFEDGVVVIIYMNAQYKLQFDITKYFVLVWI